METLKIPVWVYTAKNGYDWQGLDGSEDGATKASLDKALGAAGKAVGEWGAVVRRPVACRQWGEWPRSRLCWVLFRFHQDVRRDQRGRTCNYTAAVCIPAGAGFPRLDFGKLFASPEMSEVREDGYVGMAIDLAGGDYALEGEAGGAEPSWAASWAGPELVREDALGVLSRWCQSAGADRGDLKAVLRETDEGIVAQVAYTVFPQVAALQGAEEAYLAAAARGGGRGVREALEEWRAALQGAADFNRALGELSGLGELLGRQRMALEGAEGASFAAGELAQALSQYRISIDEAHGRQQNREQLEWLRRLLAEKRALHGGRGDWRELEAEIADMATCTETVETGMCAVRNYHAAARRGGTWPSGLESNARVAIEQVRGLYHSGRGRFMEEALREMERLFQEAQAWKVARPPARSGGGTKKWYGPDEGEMVHQKGWWTRHGEAVAWCGILLLVIGFLGMLWGWERKQRLEGWESVRKAASVEAAAGNYRAAVKKLDEIPAGWRNWVFLTRRSKFASDFRAGWEAMGEVEEKLKAARSREVDARKELSKLNPWKEKCQALPREKAPQEWSDYKDAYEKTEKLKEDNLRFNQEYGLPNRNGKIVFPTKEEAAEIPDSYDDVAKGWRDAANCLRAAGQKVEAEEEKQKLREKQERAQQELEHKKDVWQKASGPVEVARAQADAASAKLADVEERNSAFGIAKEYGGYEWRQYEFHRNQAREANWTIEVRDGLPYREKDGQWVELSVDDIQALTNHYKTAETEWCAAEASFTNACARILEHRDLKKLNEERTKAAEAFQSIQELLGKKALYEAAEKSAKAKSHLERYGAAFRRAQAQIQGVQFDEGSGLPLRGPGLENESLGRTELSELSQKFAAAETDLREAEKELNAAYQAAKEERPVKAKPGDAPSKKAPDAGGSEPRGEKGVDRGGATGQATGEGTAAAAEGTAAASGNGAAAGTAVEDADAAESGEGPDGAESGEIGDAADGARVRGGKGVVVAPPVPEKPQEEEEDGEPWYVWHPTKWKVFHPTRWFGGGEEEPAEKKPEKPGEKGKGKADEKAAATVPTGKATPGARGGAVPAAKGRSTGEGMGNETRREKK